jgi:hypothetical protein
MKLLLNQPHSIYTKTANTLKARWKNVTYGCLKCNETKGNAYYFIFVKTSLQYFSQ